MGRAICRAGVSVGTYGPCGKSAFHPAPLRACLRPSQLLSHSTLSSASLSGAKGCWAQHRQRFASRATLNTLPSCPTLPHPAPPGARRAGDPHWEGAAEELGQAAHGLVGGSAVLPSGAWFWRCRPWLRGELPCRTSDCCLASQPANWRHEAPSVERLPCFPPIICFPALSTCPPIINLKTVQSWVEACRMARQRREKQGGSHNYNKMEKGEQ